MNTYILRTLTAFSLLTTSAFFNVSATAATDSSTTATHPNVVLIYADDLGYGDLSCYGATKIKTPHTDKLAAEGVRFTNARCTASTCTPSRFSILTGQYPWRQKGTNILPGDARLIIPTDKTTLGKLLQKAGYKTAVIGKWHLGLGLEGGPDWNGEVKPGPNDVGFDYSFIFPATSDRVPTVYLQNRKVVAADPEDPIKVNYEKKIGNEPTGKENPELLKMPAAPRHGHDGTIVNGIGRIGWMTGGQKARWTDESLAGDFTEEAEMFIEQNRNQPFFLFFSMSDPHVPRMPGTRFKGKSGLGYRGDSILQMDHMVGRLTTKLEELGLSENTMVIFSSDNGPVLDDGYVDGAVTELNGHTPAGHLRGGKYSILEAGTRVPYIVKWPARIKSAVSDALISQVDLLASVGNLTGQTIPEGEAADSENLLPAMVGEDQKGRDSVVVASRALALIKDNWKYIRPQKGPAHLELVNIESGLSQEPQLYNLADDIAEKNNLAAKEPERVKAMADELAAIIGNSDAEAAGDQ